MQNILTADSSRSRASSCRQSNTAECPVNDGVDDGERCCELGRSRNDGTVIASYSSRCSFRAVITALWALEYKPHEVAPHSKSMKVKNNLASIFNIRTETARKKRRKMDTLQHLFARAQKLKNFINEYQFYLITIKFV